MAAYPDNFYLFAPAATLLSAFGALIVAFFTIRNARSTARLKATLDLIEKAESSDHYLRINASFSTVRRGRSFDRLDNPATPEDTALRRDVGAYLNHYELVAIGIDKAVLDDAMYRVWMAGPFVRDWNAAADWIQRERWRRAPGGDRWIYRDDLYANYQRVACRWSTEARRLVAGPPPPLAQPAGTQVGLGDEPLPDTSAGQDAGA